jgi:dTDP-4-dehydrorhamnose 3,5-epimerase
MNKRFVFFKKKFEKHSFIERKTIVDYRGYFERMYCGKEFVKLIQNKIVRQINRSYTEKKGTIRGMHFQVGGNCEDKIVTCIRGKVFDVIIDIRRNSKNFLKWYGKILDGKSNYANFVPYGFAHGYQTLTKNCEILYFHTDYYNKKRSKEINCFDPMVGINWPIKKFKIISNRNIKYLNKNFTGI